MSDVSLLGPPWHFPNIPGKMLVLQESLVFVTHKRGGGMETQIFLAIS